MTKRYEDSTRANMLERLKNLTIHAVLRSDFEGLGSYRQISRGLKALQTEGVLVKIGRGIYAKAYLSKYCDRPIIEGGFETACQEALDRLGVKWAFSSAIQDYNAGLSTQVPARLTVKLKSRFRRTLSYGKHTLLIQKRSYRQQIKKIT